MAGYAGYSMSNNAVDAYNEGKMPLSKWTKKKFLELLPDIIQEGLEDGYPVAEDVVMKLSKVKWSILKEEFLFCSSYHHTSSWYNATDFYDIARSDIWNLRDKDIDELIAKGKATRKKEPMTEERWECRFLDWSGTRNHPHTKEFTEVGTIRGNWFYRKDGTKKSITANGFEKIRKI